MALANWDEVRFAQNEDIEVLNEVTSRLDLINRRKGLRKFSKPLAVTRVYRGHVLAALTRSQARRLDPLQPPPPSPAPCPVYDGRLPQSSAARADKRYSLVGFEGHVAQTFWCCIHGDLHGENVLVTPEAASVLIDYGDVGDGARSLDALMLEFSPLFHPKSPFVNGPWPSVAQAEHWFDLAVYLENCPYPRLVASTRAWVLAAAAGNREIAAAAYSYFIRQLKYETTDGTRAMAFMRGARDLYNTT